MILRKIKISELSALTQSADYKSWKQLPISPARAYSQSVNPYAHPDDIALVIALGDGSNELLAYAGAYPSKMDHNDSVRYAWNTCWWVADGVGGDVAMNVFISFLQTWEKKVAFSDMTEKTFKIVRSLGFCHTMQREGFVINIRPGISSRLRSFCISKRKMSFVARPLLLTGIPWITDQLSEIAWLISRQFSSRRNEKTEPVILDFPVEKDFEFMRKYGNNSFHIPVSGELKLPSWLVRPDRENNFLREKYHFSSFAFRFSTFWLRWENEGITNALLMVSLKDGVLKTLYSYCSEEFQTKFPSLLMDYCMSTSQIRTLITAQPSIVDYVSQNKFFILSRKQFTRYSAVSNDLLKHFENYPLMQDGDGDYKFT